MKKIKCGFTLIEVVVALTLFTFVIIGIITAVIRANKYVQISKLQVQAMNLAREGVEMIYTIRDTNWKRRSGKRDEHWLGSDPLNSGSSSIASGVYYRIEQRISTGTNKQQYPALSGFKTNINNCSDPYEDLIGCSGYNNFLVEFTGKVSLSGSLVPLSGLMETEAEFYRVVKVFGLYDKRGTGANTIVGGSFCSGNNCPKELRFCVKVFYVGAEYGFSELCSVMTNFKA